MYYAGCIQPVPDFIGYAWRLGLAAISHELGGLPYPASPLQLGHVHQGSELATSFIILLGI